MSDNPTLYYNVMSPPSRAVTFVGKAIGIEFNITHINIGKGDHLTPEYLKVKQAAKCHSSHA